MTDTRQQQITLAGDLAFGGTLALTRADEAAYLHITPRGFVRIACELADGPGYVGSAREYLVGVGPTELDVTALRDALSPGGALYALAQRVVAGLRTPGGADADAELRSLVEAERRSGTWTTGRIPCSAVEYLLGGHGDYTGTGYRLARDYGLSADSTDAELEALSDRLLAEATRARIAIWDDAEMVQALELCRDELRAITHTHKEH